MKILLAADGSDYTKRMLAYLAAHDEWLGNRHQYTVLTVVPAVPPRAAAVIAKDDLAEYYRDEADKVFTPIRAFFKQNNIDAHYQTEHGHAAEVIAATADKVPFDLLMMGSHGHGTLANLVMGSVATKVLAQCGVPVLLVR
jgi:nucleotide-binding universal stress UspA family protein